ncbi:MAG: hypothetical protein KKA90_03605 [Nanoarchaeota archaeon]|nr:hypothetical protein [Nanoarchaeota archaeon]
MKQGSSTILAVVLLAVILIVLSSFAALYFPQVLDPYSSCVKIVGFDEGAMTLQNCGSKDIPTFTVTINGVPVGTFQTDRSIPVGESRDYQLHFLPNDKLRVIRVLTGNAIDEMQFDVDRGWVIHLNEPIFTLGSLPTIEFTGYVELNDGSGQLYTNKRIKFTVYKVPDNYPEDSYLDDEPIIELGTDEDPLFTDENGEFTTEPQPWDEEGCRTGGFCNLYPGQYWEAEIALQTPTSDTIIQPFSQAKYITPSIFDGGHELIVGTQNPYLILSNQTAIYGYKDIVPSDGGITPTELSFDQTQKLVVKNRNVFDSYNINDYWFGTSYHVNYTTEEGAKLAESIEKLTLSCKDDGENAPNVITAPCKEGLVDLVVDSPQSSDGIDGINIDTIPPETTGNPLYDANNQVITVPIQIYNKGSSPTFVKTNAEVLLMFQSTTEDPYLGCVKTSDTGACIPYQLFTITNESVYFVEDETTIQTSIQFSLDDIKDALRERYGIEEEDFYQEKTYILRVSAVAAGTTTTVEGASFIPFAFDLQGDSLIAFNTGIGPIQSRPDKVCGESADISGYCAIGVKSIYWKFTDLATDFSKISDGDKITFSSILSAARPETENAYALGVRDLLFAVDPATNLVKKQWQAGSGMIYPGTSKMYLTQLEIPSQRTDSEKILSVYIIPEIEFIVGGNANLKLKIRMMNTYPLVDENAFDYRLNDITLYKRRGDRVDCSQFFMNVDDTLTCDITANTQPGEELQNLMNRKVIGLDLAFRATVKPSTVADIQCSYDVAPAPACTLTVTGNPECQTFISKQTCHEIQFKQQGEEKFFVIDPGQLFETVQGKITIDALQPDTTASATLSLWNQYLQTELVWNNQLTHVLTIETIEPDNFYPAFTEHFFQV